MATLKIHGGSAFLNWRATTPRLYVTAESDDFDDLTLQAWRDEGFEVNYLPFGDGGKQYVKTLHSLKDGLGVGGTYAIVGISPDSPGLLSSRIVKLYSCSLR